MKIAILGGSFNPVHIGHLALADDVVCTLGYDRVLFVPTATPPHKQMNQALSGEDRLRLVKAACSSNPAFEAEDCELVRGGVSYTWDTVQYLQKKYQGVLEGKLGLIMGDDLLAEFHLWNHAREIAQNCQLILARRPQVKRPAGSFEAHSNKPVGEYGKISEEERLAHPFNIKDEPLFADALTIENPMLTISSTDIRRRIADGNSFQYLVSQQVFDFIAKGGFYGYHR